MSQRYQPADQNVNLGSMIPTDGMAIPRIKQGFSFFIRGIAMPSVGILGLPDSSIAISGTSAFRLMADPQPQKRSPCQL